MVTGRPLGPTMEEMPGRLVVENPWLKVGNEGVGRGKEGVKLPDETLLRVVLREL